MRIFESVDHFIADGPTVVTIGTFDGVHLGHKKILDRLKQEAKAGESTLLTFFPHPRMVLHGESAITLLNTIEERITLLEQAGIANLIIHPFNDGFASLDAATFVESVLVNRLKARKIIIGHDHRFGVNRTAGLQDLVQFSKQFNFEVQQIPAKDIDEVTVSSTKIREALLTGDLVLANKFLGYPYMLTGQVVEGNRLGRQLGYPTANLSIAEKYKLIPANGVYAINAYIHRKLVGGMMNIGVKPTIGGNVLSIEAHFFDFNADLYHSNLRLHLVEHIRAEHAFSSVEQLKEQLQRDEIKCRAILSRL